MAPECLYGKPYAEKADVFSYGIILAEIMARIPADPEYMPRTNVSTHTHAVMHCAYIICVQGIVGNFAYHVSPSINHSIRYRTLYHDTIMSYDCY